jgi:hypothetical protein
MLRTDSPTIRLGLNIPLFIAALIAMGTGTLVGMIGIWTAAAWGRPVPEWEKVGHAHSSWWAVLIMIAAMVLPSIALKPWGQEAGDRRDFHRADAVGRHAGFLL